MALGKCKECKKEVSTSANKCPHCGVKNPSVSIKDTTIGLGVFLLIIIFAVKFCGTDLESNTTQYAADEKCIKTLSCWAEKNLVSAGIYCKSDIERLAKNSHKWTDSWAESKFSHFRWLNSETGSITYIGDKIQFQNGFGAMINAKYECDFIPQSKTVLAVRAREGWVN